MRLPLTDGSVPDLVKAFVALAAPIFTGWLGYWLGRRRFFDEKRDHTRDLATALLIELRHVEGILREMAAEARPLDFKWFIPLPWLERLFPDTRTFAPSTTQAAYQFFGLVQEIEARLQDAVRLNATTDELHWTIRVKAGSAVQRLAHLVDALRKEGGQCPPVMDVQSFVLGQLPVLPPPIFAPLWPTTEVKIP